MLALFVVARSGGLRGRRGHPLARWSGLIRSTARWSCWVQTQIFFCLLTGSRAPHAAHARRPISQTHTLVLNEPARSLAPLRSLVPTSRGIWAAFFLYRVLVSRLFLARPGSAVSSHLSGAAPFPWDILGVCIGLHVGFGLFFATDVRSPIAGPCVRRRRLVQAVSLLVPPLWREPVGYLESRGLLPEGEQTCCLRKSPTKTLPQWWFGGRGGAWVERRYWAYERNTCCPPWLLSLFRASAGSAHISCINGVGFTQGRPMSRIPTR